MYIIIVNEDNSLTASKKERIMQKSKLVDNLCFLVNPDYKGEDMTKFTVLMEYLLPVSKEYKTEFLTLSEERVEEYLKYELPFDTKMTNEAGIVEVQLTFLRADLDENGNTIQYVRKTSVGKIRIVPISAWSNLIPDASLSSLDQRILKTEAMINELEDLNQQLLDNQDNKADGLFYEDSVLQLLSGNKKIGNQVTITNISTEDNADGNIKVVHF